MPPAIHLIPALPAALVIARYRDGEVLVLVDADQPWRRIEGLRFEPGGGAPSMQDSPTSCTVRR